ncbi:MAG: hypothetical protein RSC24_06235 [Clostridium sp.]
MNSVVKKAEELNKYEVYIPELDENDIVELNDVWDGEGEVPECSCSYFLTDEGEDGNSNYNISINYEFDIIEEKEDPLDTLVRITCIELI